MELGEEGDCIPIATLTTTENDSCIKTGKVEMKGDSS